MTFDLAKYLAMPEAEWDGAAMLYDESTGRFFTDWDDVVDAADANRDDGDERGAEQLAKTMPLVICFPDYGHEIEPEDYWSECLPEDIPLRQMAPLLADLVEAVNAHIRFKAEVLGWFPGKTRLAGQTPPAPEGTDGKA